MLIGHSTLPPFPQTSSDNPTAVNQELIPTINRLQSVINTHPEFQTTLNTLGEKNSVDLMEALTAVGMNEPPYVATIFRMMLDIKPYGITKIIEQLPKLKGFSPQVIKQILLILGGHEPLFTQQLVDEFVSRRNDPRLLDEINKKALRRPLGDERVLTALFASISFEHLTSF